MMVFRVVFFRVIGCDSLLTLFPAVRPLEQKRHEQGVIQIKANRELALGGERDKYPDTIGDRALEHGLYDKLVGEVIFVADGALQSVLQRIVQSPRDVQAPHSW